MNKYEILKQIIDSSQSLVIFTGAGISVPSGIPDFRSADGIYNKKTGLNVKPEEIISHSYFEKNPESFYEFYTKHMIYPNAKPNIAHKFFANLERIGKNVTIITQNIDGLHQEAGSKRVYELHGTTKSNYCTVCGKHFNLDTIIKANGVPKCDRCGGIIKPDVTLYEEELDDLMIQNAIAGIMTCDTLIVIGTSLTVYPAAGFIRYFRGTNLVLLNKEETSFDNMCDLVINEDIEKIIEHIN